MLSLVYGKNVGQRLMESKRTIHKIYITAKNFESELGDKIRQQKLPYEIVDNKFLDRLCELANHQGIALEVEEYQTCSLDELLASVPENELGLLIMLDGVVDPHNLGAILRNCDGAKAHGVIIGKHHRAPLNATVAKVSSGAIETVKVAEVSNLNQSIKTLKDQGYWIAGCEAKGENLYDFKFDTPLVLVIGSESKGISVLVKKNCDYFVSIPLAGQVNSLNAAVASGIIMYQVLRQRSLLKAKDGGYDSI